MIARTKIFADHIGNSLTHKIINNDLHERVLLGCRKGNRDSFRKRIRERSDLVASDQITLSSSFCFLFKGSWRPFEEKAKYKARTTRYFIELNQNSALRH